MLVDYRSLLQRLKHDSAAVRIETLWILAMVEETRAINAIAWVFKNDLNADVRHVALCAGRLLWQAQQRGHTTQKAIEESYKQELPDDLEEIYLDSLARDMHRGKSSDEIQDQVIQQRLRREMMSAREEKGDQPIGLSLADLADDVLENRAD